MRSPGRATRQPATPHATGHTWPQCDHRSAFPERGMMDIEILEELRGKDPDALGANEPDEVRHKTPEELVKLVDVIDAHLRSLHQTDSGELRDLSDAEDKAFRYGLRVREAALKRIEEHRAVSEVFSRRPEAVKRVYANIKHGLNGGAGGNVARMPSFEA